MKFNKVSDLEALLFVTFFGFIFLISTINVVASIVYYFAFVFTWLYINYERRDRK